MKQMAREYCAGLLVSVALVVVPAAPSILQAQALSCSVGLDRDSLLVAEPIWTDVTVSNLSGDDIRSFCLTHSPERGCFLLFDENGEGVPYSGLIVDRGPGGLADGQTWGMTYNLLDHFGRGWFDPPRHLPPGRYEVRFVCKGLCDAALDTFVVVEPRGTDLEAYDLYARGEKLSVRKGRKDAAIEAYETVLGEYRDSRYAEASLSSLISVLSLQDRYDEAYRRCLEFLDAWPESGFMRDVVTRLVCLTPSKDEGIELLQSIIADHRGTRAARFARRQLGAIESGKSRLWKDRHLRYLERMGRR